MEYLVPTLMLGKLGFVLGFAYLSIRGLEKMKDGDAPKSSLSVDGARERLEVATVNRG